MPDASSSNQSDSSAAQMGGDPAGQMGGDPVVPPGGDAADQRSESSDERTPLSTIDQNTAHATNLPPRPPVINPYSPEYEAIRRSLKRRTLRPFNLSMGCQSQNRNGAVKNAMKKGAKMKRQWLGRGNKKLVQQGIHGKAFIQFRDCRICVAKHRRKLLGNHIRVPKRAHDERCPENRNTRGKSKRTVEIEKIVAANLKANNIAPDFNARFKAIDVARLLKIPIPSNLLEDDDKQTTRAEAAAASTGDNSAKTSSDASATSDPTPSATEPQPEATVPEGTRNDNEVAVTPFNDVCPGDYGKHLREVLDMRMLRFNDGTAHQEAKKANAPINVFLMLKYIKYLTKWKQTKSTKSPVTSVTAMAQEQMENRDLLMGRSRCVYRFPTDTSKEPSPYYHALEGSEIFILDWRAMFPSINLPCPYCRSGTLKNYRSNMPHGQTLFPVYQANGTVMWGEVMKYRCQGGKCKQNIVTANDSRLLISLPAHVRQCYPVDPHWAHGAFHFSKDLSDDLDSLMKTYANGEFFSKNLLHKAARQYVRVLESYLSKCSRGKAQPWTLDFKDWIGRFPPSGDSIRKYYMAAENCSAKPYGYSNVERYNREIQSVGKGKIDAACVDHTFAVRANYKDKDAKACFTYKIDTGETANLLLVPSKSLKDVAHGLQAMTVGRSMLCPRVVYADTCPDDEGFWKDMYGETLLMRLGLFHCMKRIMDTFNRVDTELRWKAIVQLRRCFYRYNPEDLEALMTALRDGTLNGKEHTPAEINDLQHSKAWKQNYDKYLRKEIHGKSTIVSNLSEFNDYFQFVEDIDGQRLYTGQTQDTILQQYEVVQYVSDPQGMVMYHVVPAPEGSPHGLPTYVSKRLESKLEWFHMLLAHFGNGGMTNELADALTMRGTCEDNVAIRHRGQLRMLPNRKDAGGWPHYVKDTPIFFDHSMLAWVNGRCVELGIRPIFHDVHRVDKDNGERFMSQYLQQQMIRNRHLSLERVGMQCNCASCSAMPFPLFVNSQPNVPGTPTINPTIGEHPDSDSAQPVGENLVDQLRDQQLDAEMGGDPAGQMGGDPAGQTGGGPDGNSRQQPPQGPSQVTKNPAAKARRKDAPVPTARDNSRAVRMDADVPLAPVLPTTPVMPGNAFAPTTPTSIVGAVPCTQQVPNAPFVWHQPLIGSMVPTMMSTWMPQPIGPHFTMQNNMSHAHSVPIKPEDCCFYHAPFYCDQFARYKEHKMLNPGKVLGRPPHDKHCLALKKRKKKTTGPNIHSAYL